jgi:hypothetical protein
VQACDACLHTWLCHRRGYYQFLSRWLTTCLRFVHLQRQGPPFLLYTLVRLRQTGCVDFPLEHGVFDILIAIPNHNRCRLFRLCDPPLNPCVEAVGKRNTRYNDFRLNCKLMWREPVEGLCLMTTCCLGDKRHVPAHRVCVSNRASRDVAIPQFDFVRRHWVPVGSVNIEVPA